MISKNDTKRINQFQQKKFRYKEGVFIAETPKVVEEFLIAGFVRKYWFATDSYEVPKGIQGEPVRISPAEMKGISRLETANTVLAVFEMPTVESIQMEGRVLALDGVRDPGNMGTIIRLADWFGMDEVWLSEDCVDIWNPKVVQSSMGSLARVRPKICHLPDAVSTFVSEGGKAYVADMDGESHYSVNWASDCVLIMGNEGVGPSDELVELSKNVVSIPRFGEHGPESLNVAMATGILLAEINRP